MRILYYFFLFFAVITALLILIFLINNALEGIKQSVQYTLEDITEEYNISVNLSDYDLITLLQPYIKGLNYVLIIGFLAAIVGSVIYTRRRE